MYVNVILSSAYRRTTHACERDVRMGSSPTTPISYVSIHAVDDPCGTQFDCRRRRPLVIADDNDDNRILNYLYERIFHSRIFCFCTYIIGPSAGVYMERATCMHWRSEELSS